MADSSGLNTDATYTAFMQKKVPLSTSHHVDVDENVRDLWIWLQSVASSTPAVDLSAASNGNVTSILTHMATSLAAEGHTLTSLRQLNRAALLDCCRRMEWSVPCKMLLLGALDSDCRETPLGTPSNAPSRSIVASVLSGDAAIAVLESSPCDGRVQRRLLCSRCDHASYAAEVRPLMSLQGPPPLCPSPPPPAAEPSFMIRADYRQLLHRHRQPPEQEEGPSSPILQPFSVASAMFVTTWRRVLCDGSSDGVSLPRLLATLRRFHSGGDQLTACAEWWRRCVTLTEATKAARRCSQKRASSRASNISRAAVAVDPPLDQVLHVMSSGSVRAVEAVVRRYTPHGGRFAVREEALLQGQSAYRHQPEMNAAFLDTMSHCSDPDVCTAEDVMRCWRQDPSLALPFLGFFIVHSEAGAFVAKELPTRKSVSVSPRKSSHRPSHSRSSRSPSQSNT